MLVYKAIKMKERGDSLRVIASDLRSCAGIKNIVFFTLPTLKYLKQSGRIGRLEGSVGEILNVKPMEQSTVVVFSPSPAKPGG
jgi:fatty acid-binding protein DegV